MKMLLNNCDNDLFFDNTYVNTIEILNKKAFYQMLKDINDLNNQDNITFIEDSEFTNMQSKVSIVYDYVNFDFDNKKVSSGVLSLVNSSIDENKKEEINKIYKKLCDFYRKIIGEFDLNIEIQEEFTLQDISKLMKLTIVPRETLLNNLLLLLDLESEFHLNKLIVFINLKDYLENDELSEFYKYALYKNVSILLIDNTKHFTNNFEKKLLIDEDLVEFVL